MESIAYDILADVNIIDEGPSNPTQLIGSALKRDIPDVTFIVELEQSNEWDEKAMLNVIVIELDSEEFSCGVDVEDGGDTERDVKYNHQFSEVSSGSGFDGSDTSTSLAIDAEADNQGCDMSYGRDDISGSYVYSSLGENFERLEPSMTNEIL